MIKCLVLGGEGMLGHMLVKYLKSLPDFEVYFTSRGKQDMNAIYFDAYNDFKFIEEILREIKPDLVVNCIGIINKFVTEENKEEVLFVNSVLPHKLARICNENDSKFIQISTDCVFSGEIDDSSRIDGIYTEESKVSPTDFYGLSKACGEVNDDYNLTIRTSLIGPELDKYKSSELKELKNGLMEWFLAQDGKKIKGYTDVIWSGVTTLELCKQIVEMYNKGVTGLINIVSEPISKFDLLNLIKDVYEIDVKIEKDDLLKCDRSMKSVKNIQYIVPDHLTMLLELKELETKLK